MKTFTHFEENIVFRFSRGFWRVIVIFAIGALCAGTIGLIWSLIPPSKQQVVKQEYPKITPVQLSDIESYIRKLEASKTEQVTSGTTAEPSNEPAQAPVSREFSSDPVLKRVYDSLQQLIPPVKYSYQPRGHWDFPYGYYSTYKKWVEDDPGLNHTIINSWSVLKISVKDSGIVNYPEAVKLLRSYLPVVRKFSNSKRVAILYTMLAITSKTPDSTVMLVNNFKKFVSVFDTAKMEPYYDLAGFIYKNPKDSPEFLSMLDSTINHFKPKFRTRALSAMVNNYRNYFNNNILLEKELTKSFVTLIPSIDTAKLINYLDTYYKLGYNSNQERSEQIARIDGDFDNAQFLAQTNYELQKEKKNLAILILLKFLLEK